MAALPTRITTGLLFWNSVLLLLLVFCQMLTILVFNAGVFILSNEVLISPSNFDLLSLNDELSCRSRSCGVVSGIEILNPVVFLGLYAPVVLVPFALLAMMLAAYAKDRTVLRLSMGCQGASSLLILMGTISFLLINQSYVSQEHMTIWFYIWVGVPLELMLSTALTYVSVRRLKSHWD